MVHCGRPRQPGRDDRVLRLAGVGLMGALSLSAVSFATAILPAPVAGASNPASLNCGTLVISGTDGNNYQFSEFTTGNASRSGSDASGSVAYGGTLNTSSGWTTAQSISPSASQLTTLVGGSETGQLVVQKGSAVIAGTAGGPIFLNQTGATETVDGGASTLPFSFSSVGSALTTCSNNYGPNASTTTGTVAGVGFSSPDTQVLGFWGTGSVNVFAVTADQLAAAERLDFSVPAGSTNLVQVQISTDHSTSLSVSGISGASTTGARTPPPRRPTGAAATAAASPAPATTPLPSVRSATIRSGTSLPASLRRATP